MTVQLPGELAAAARRAWMREDSGDNESESQAERAIRHQAGVLALIGLALSECTAPAEGDEVTVELHAWQVGSALDAADERGLLLDLQPPRLDG